MLCHFDHEADTVYSCNTEQKTRTKWPDKENGQKMVDLQLFLTNNLEIMIFLIPWGEKVIKY